MRTDSFNLTHFLVFALLFGTLLSARSRRDLSERGVQAWILDVVSLGTFFLILPVAEAAIGYRLYQFLIPSLQGTLPVGWGMAILLYCLMDYGWYWNHRLLHAKTPLWHLHAVHHEAESLDILASQRNSLWSFLFMIYFWFVPLVLFVARDPAPFLTLSAFGVLINFWGHTRLDLPRNSLVRRILSLAVVQPEDHFWHHSADRPNCNFGTILNFWDRIHGTWHQPNVSAQKLGFEWKAPLWRKVLFPI